MGDTEVTQGFCGECGRQLEEPTSTPVAERNPCPICGSLDRQAKVGIRAKVGLHAAVGTKARAPGERQPFLEGKYGDYLFKKTGLWHKIEQTIDRRGNRYRKKITDREGNVTRDDDDPLTDHIGHGSAKRTND